MFNRIYTQGDVKIEVRVETEEGLTLHDMFLNAEVLLHKHENGELHTYYTSIFDIEDLNTLRDNFEEYLAFDPKLQLMVNDETR